MLMLLFWGSCDHVQKKSAAVLQILLSENTVVSYVIIIYLCEVIGQRIDDFVGQLTHDVILTLNPGDLRGNIAVCQI